MEEEFQTILNEDSLEELNDTEDCIVTNIAEVEEDEN